MKRQKRNNPNKTTKIEEILVTYMFNIDLQHAVAALGDKTEPESSLRSSGLFQPGLKST